MADPEKSPLDQMLDLLVFAPLGAALTVRDELPKLIEKGRKRADSQINMARMIGQFAVTQGQREVEKRLASFANLPSAPARTGGAATAVPAAETAVPGAVPAEPKAATGPEGSLLAIPGYDSLSASQVVQRLAGLSAAELDAVRSYEDAHRGRRTILSKVTQLQQSDST